MYPKKEYFSGFAETYDATMNIACSYYAPDEICKLARRHFQACSSLNDPIRVLDFGAGTGIVSEKISAIFPQAEITAVDISGEMLQVGVDNNRFDQFYIADLSQDRLPIASQQFDLVVSCGASEYIGNLSHFLSEVRHLIKPDGLFVSTFLNADSDLSKELEDSRSPQRTPIKDSKLRGEFKSAHLNIFRLKRIVGYKDHLAHSQTDYLLAAAQPAHVAC